MYGSAQLEGYILSDVICLEALQIPKNATHKNKDDDSILEDIDFSKCVGDFPFIAIKNMSGLNEGI